MKYKENNLTICSVISFIALNDSFVSAVNEYLDQ